ncbi:hypothetical protein AAKU52_003358 [Pedobacter sp. CG_S7]|uniref:hypothetical protein n=1 Tax=Pedobacter sp. CG_S7 TaxID=3143930 RepID=UPI00339ACEED
MKGLITLTILLISFSLSAQSVKFNLQGSVKDTKNAKFAFISTLSQQVTISSPKIFMVTPIVNGKFQFNDTFDLEGKQYQNACVFVDERGNISKEELAFKFKQLVWVTGRENHLRRIILENIKLDIEQRDQMITSKIVSGGTLTKQLDENNQAVRDKNRKLLEFIKKYPDSPVSLIAVKDNNSIFDPSNKEKYESNYGLPSELFILLSERLRKSKEGLKLIKEINKKSNK